MNSKKLSRVTQNPAFAPFDKLRANGHFKNFKYLTIFVIAILASLSPLNAAEYFAKQRECSNNVDVFCEKFFEAGAIGLVIGAVDKPAAYTISGAWVLESVALARYELDTDQKSAIISAYVVGALLGRRLNRQLRQII